ncbi:hypothetical protein OIU76_002286 [Salix suchowensis]|nr:hypothetical protein OIU76_002286 [Salix suchowensis]
MAENNAFFEVTGRGCRHFGIDTKMDRKQLAANHKLRALMSTTKTGEVNKISSSIANRFSECKYLRVLDLCKSIFEMPLTSLLSHIGFLQHLTYLSLSNTHPLIQLPPALESLINLTILNLSYSQNLKGRLSNLEVLLGFRPARASQLKGCRIAELRNLSQLRKLGLHLVWDDEIGDSEVSALVNLQQLQFLTISCFDSHGSDLVDKLDKLYPPPGLLELCLQFYPGKLSPAWLNPISLHMLRFLWISSGNLAVMHESFFGENNSAWNIEGLMFESLSDLEMEWQTVQQVMPSLKTVHASWCPNLESFPIEDVGFRGGVWTKGEHRR